MSAIDCSSEMSKFHSNEVTLPKAEQVEMRDRRDAGRKRLQKGLERDGVALPSEQASQGSYAMRTMVQDPQYDYDIDDGAYFEKAGLTDASGTELTPLASRQMVCRALRQDERLKHDAIIKPNCVRQPYPQGYHIDIPVYRILRGTDLNGGDTVSYELASGDSWVGSDARAVTGWFNGYVTELNEGEADGSQLRRIVRLTKKFARSRLPWKERTTSGICVTKLVVDSFVARVDRDDLSLRDTWNAVHRILSGTLRIQHPVSGTSDLAPEGDPEVGFLRQCVRDALRDLQGLDSSDCTRAKAREIWDKVFNTSFFGEQPADDGSGGGQKASGPFVVVSSDVARRDDGGRRYG
jgi:hypothetical protein